MSVGKWAAIGDTGLEASNGDDGMVYFRTTTAGIRQVELERLQQMAGVDGVSGSVTDAWTPELARAVLRALRLDVDQ